MKTIENGGRMIHMHKYVFMLILFFMCAHITHAASPCRLVYFYDPDCEECKKINNLIIPSLYDKYKQNIEIIKKDVSIVENFRNLLRFEAHFNVSSPEIPEIFSASTFLSKNSLKTQDSLVLIIEQELSSKMPGPYAGFISEYLQKETEKVADKQVLTDKQVLKIYVFLKKGCKSCDKFNIGINHLKQENHPNIQWIVSDIASRKAMILNEALCEKYSIDDRLHLTAPSVFFSEKAYVNSKNLTDGHIYTEISELLKKGGFKSTPELSTEELSRAEKRITARFQAFKISAIMIAGLLDGINPCAFVTIIFLISYLSIKKFKKKDILLIGTAFSVSVFLTYFAIGLGLFKVLEYFRSFDYIRSVIFFISVSFLFVIGLMNIWDFIKIRRGAIGDMTLKMSDNVRMKINFIIRKYVKVRYFVIGASMIGFSVSIFEFACTGQVYLPTICFILNFKGMQFEAISMLFLYNMAFIVPLIIVFTAFMTGVSEKMLSGWLQTHGGIIKLAIGVICIAFSLILLTQVFL